MKHALKRLTLWLVQGTIGLALFAMIMVFLLDYTAGCGQTYIDSQGVTHNVAKNSECIVIKHHGKE